MKIYLTIVLILLFLFKTDLIQSGPIKNMQVYLRDIPSKQGFHLSFEGNVYSKSTNTSKTWNYSFDPSFICYYIFPNQHVIFSQTEFEYKSAEGETYINNFFEHLRPRINLIKGWVDLNLLFQYEINEKARIDKRITGGAGFRINLYSKTKKIITHSQEISKHEQQYYRRSKKGDEVEIEHSTKIKKETRDEEMIRISLGLLYIYEYEQTARKKYADAGKKEYAQRLSSFGDFSILLFNDIYFVTTFYYQPMFKDFSDYRILNDNTLEFKINSRFSILSSNIYTYDSRPPLKVKKSEYIFKTGVKFSFF